MRLAVRLILVLVLLNGSLLAADGFFLVRRAEEDFDAGVRRNADMMGKMLGRLVGDTWQAGGRSRALDLIAEANLGASAPRIRWSDEHVGGQKADPRDADSRFTHVPVSVDGRVVGNLEIAEPLAPLRSLERQTVYRVLMLTGVMAVASTLVIIWFGLKWIGHPLDLLIEKVRRVGVGDLSGPVRLAGRSELSELSEAVNVMCEDLARAEERTRAETEARIEAVGQLRHSDRLRTVGRLASGMAHELGTPLNVISARAGMIAQGKLDPEEVKGSASIIRDQSDRMTALIRQLLDFARPGKPRRVTVDLRSLLKETAELVSSLGYPGKVRLPSEGEEVRARVDPAQMQQVLANLVVNGLQAMPEGGEVRLAARAVRRHPSTDPDAPEREYACISVEDDGVGIAEKDLPHVFEPFFTTKGVGEGTGLGLSIAHGIAHEHGGWIEVTSEPEKGSVFRVYLPRGDD